MRNNGIAFGLFYRHEGVLIAIISLSIVFLFWWGHRASSHDRSDALSLGLVVGGAIGNWIDRLRGGGVIDFFDFRVWPVFNIADISISVGVGLYLLMYIKKSRINPL